MRGDFEILLILRFDSLTQKNCPAGCPCDAYKCDDVTTTTTSMATTTTASTMKKAVLMLNTYDSGNVPMVIGFNGE